MVQDWPSPKKRTDTDQMGVHNGNGDRLGSAGLRVTRTSNTTPQNSVSDKARYIMGMVIGWARQGPE